MMLTDSIKYASLHHTMLLYASKLLRLHLAIVLDINVFVACQTVDLVCWELGAVDGFLSASDLLGSRRSVTYEKPFTSLNSLVILPPCSVTCFLAASS